MISAYKYCNQLAENLSGQILKKIGMFFSLLNLAPKWNTFN